MRVYGRVVITADAVDGHGFHGGRRTLGDAGQSCLQFLLKNR